MFCTKSDLGLSVHNVNFYGMQVFQNFIRLRFDHYLLLISYKAEICHFSMQGSQHTHHFLLLFSAGWYDQNFICDFWNWLIEFNYTSATFIQKLFYLDQNMLYITLVSEFLLCLHASSMSNGSELGFIVLNLLP